MSDDVIYYGENGLPLPPLGQKIMNQGVYKYGESEPLQVKDVKKGKEYEMRYDGERFIIE